MCGFITKNSIYYVDQSAKVIWGGIIGELPKPFVTAQILIGQPAIISFTDGSKIKTGKVRDYI